MKSTALYILIRMYKNAEKPCAARLFRQIVVEGDGFEPSKSLTTDLQSAPFGRSGTPP